MSRRTVVKRQPSLLLCSYPTILMPKTQAICHQPLLPHCQRRYLLRAVAVGVGHRLVARSLALHQLSQAVLVWEATPVRAAAQPA